MTDPKRMCCAVIALARRDVDYQICSVHRLDGGDERLCGRKVAEAHLTCAAADGCSQLNRASRCRESQTKNALTTGEEQFLHPAEFVWHNVKIMSNMKRLIENRHFP